MSRINLRSISDEINQICSEDQNRRLDKYIGHLRRENKARALRQHHFLISDCDKAGNLTEKDIFVQFVGTTSVTGEKKFILLCKSCNENVKGLLHIFLKSNIEEKFHDKVVSEYCIHCSALAEMSPEKSFELEPENFPFCHDENMVDVEILETSPYQCAVLCRGEYGLITFPPRAKKPRCIMPCKNSRTCHHTVLWERCEGTHKVENPVKPSEMRKESNIEHNRTLPKKMKWPPNSETQSEFRKLARTGYSYSEMIQLVPEYDDRKCCKMHGNKFDDRNPVDMMWIMSRKVVIINSDWVDHIERVVYYRPTVSDSKCDCKQTWTGEKKFLLNITKGQKGRTTYLMTYNFLLTYTYVFVKSGTTLRGFINAHNKRLVDQYGATDMDLVPFHIFREAVFLFWENVLNLNPKATFVCPECGPRPATLCCDGVAVGMLWDKVRNIPDLVLPFESSSILDAPPYKERMFIKMKKNRDFLKKSLGSTEYPKFSRFDFSKEPNMELVKHMCEELKSQGYRAMPDAVSGILHDLSSNSSTVSLFQVIDVDILSSLQENLFSSSTQLVIDQSTIELKNQCIKRYPVLFDRLLSASNMTLSNGRIPQTIKKLYGEIIKFTLDFYNSLEVREREHDYSRRQDGEIKSEVFPQFPVLFDRPKYEADQRSSKKDKDAWESLCSKLFPEHSDLTPGLFVVTCCCPEKKVYGYKKNGSRREPQTSPLQDLSNGTSRTSFMMHPVD